MLTGAGMGQRLSPCISTDSGRGETRAVVLLWEDPQLQAMGLAFISEAELSQPEAQNSHGASRCCFARNTEENP